MAISENSEKYLDDIISRDINVDIDDNDVEENTGDEFDIRISLFRSFTVDASSFDWDDLIANKEKIITNEDLFQSILVHLLNAKTEEIDAVIDTAKKTVSNFMVNGMGATLSYEMELDPKTEAMMMLFDTILFIREMTKQIELMETVKLCQRTMTEDEMHALAVNDLISQLAENANVSEIPSETPISEPQKSPITDEIHAWIVNNLTQEEIDFVDMYHEDDEDNPEWVRIRFEGINAKMEKLGFNAFLVTLKKKYGGIN